MMAFYLFGFGFGQLCRPPECDGKSKEASSGVREEEGDMLVCLPHKLMSFPSKPLNVHFSSAWDALHISAVCSSGCYSHTTGRWSEVMQSIKKTVTQEGSQNGGDGSQSQVLRVVDVKDSVILQTGFQTLVAVAAHPHELRASSLPHSLQLITLSGGRLFAATPECGKVHQISLGSNPPTELTLGPCIASLPQPISQISCGTDHALMLTSTGAVYAYGLGSRGQLGLGDILPRKEPCLMEALAGVAMASIACGHWHSMSLSEYGDVYSWGWNEHGQLGHSNEPGEVTKTVPLPKVVDIEAAGSRESNCVSISCGSRHSATVTDNGVLYTWGWNG